MKHISEVDPISLIKPSIVSDPEFNCSDCRDVGWIKDSDRMRRCEKCFPQRVEDKIAMTCGEHYRKCDISNFDYISGKQSLLGKVKSIKIPDDIRFDCSYMFYGPHGVGKSHIAISLFRRDLLAGKNVVWLTEQRLLRDAQQYLYNWNRSPNNEAVATIFDNPTDLGGVYIDDIGKENITDNRKTVIYNFIETMYKNSIKLVMTTNVIGFKKWLGEEIGKAVLSRVVGMCHVVKFDTDKDRRTKT